MYAFLYYKVFKPDLARPFAIPGKVFGAVLMVIPVLAVTLGNMYISISKDFVITASTTDAASRPADSLVRTAWTIFICFEIIRFPMSGFASFVLSGRG